MQIELDHLFVCTAPAAPEAGKLVQFGLNEGPPNQHRYLGCQHRILDAVNDKIGIEPPY